MNKGKNFYWSLVIIILLLATISPFIVPDRYLFDAYTISLDRHNEAAWLGSYPFSMMFYKVTRLGELSFSVVSWIQLPIVFYLLYRLKVPHSFYKLTLRNAVVWLAFLVCVVYLGIPSKEFITVLWIFLISFILISRISLVKKIFYSLCLFMFFGWFFRQYFILVPLIALGLMFASQIKIKNKALANTLIGLTIVAFMSLSHGIIKGRFITESFRNEFNVQRVESGNENAATMILSPVSPDTFHGEVFGIVYGFFSVNLPVQGLRFLLRPQVIIFVVWQLCLFSLLFYYYNNALKKRTLYKHELWIFHLLFAYFLVQGVFEPDLGSAVKHKLGVLPLIWLAIYYDKKMVFRPKFIKKYVFKVAR